MIEPIYNREYFDNRLNETKNQHVRDILDLITYFKTTFNLQLHVHYGTLLGVVRDHDFIPYDKDIDLVYISEFSHTEVVKKELVDIATILKEHKMLVKDFNNRGQMHVRVPNGSLVVDVFTSWIDNGKYNLVPFGEICTEDIIFPFKVSTLRCQKLLIPNQSEKLLDILYKDWKNPISKDENYLKLPKRSNLK